MESLRAAILPSKFPFSLDKRVAIFNILGSKLLSPVTLSCWSLDAMCKDINKNGNLTFPSFNKCVLWGSEFTRLFSRVRFELKQTLIMV